MALEPLRLQRPSHRLQIDGDADRSVPRDPRHRAQLGEHALHDVADRHARWESVRIDDQVGNHAVFAEGHVVLRQDQAHHALLAVAGRHFVAQLRRANLPETHLQDAALSRPPAHKHPVDFAVVMNVRRHRAVSIRDHFFRLAHHATRHLLHLAVDLHHADHRHLGTLGHKRLGRHPAVSIKHGIRGLRQLQRHLCRGVFRVRWVGKLHVFVLTHVTLGHRERLIRRQLEEPALHRRAVDDHAVFLIEARVRHDRHDSVEPARHAVAQRVVRGHRRHERPLGRVQHIGHRIESFLEIGGVDAHGLLGLGPVENVARRLVVVRKRDIVGHNAQQRRRVELGVRVLGGDVFQGHGHQRRVLFFGIQKLDAAAQRLEARHQLRQRRRVLQQAQVPGPRHRVAVVGRLDLLRRRQELAQEQIEPARARVRIRQPRPAALDDQQRPAQAPRVR